MTSRNKVVQGVAVAAVVTATALSAPSPAAAHEAKPGGRTHQECRGVTVDRSAPVISRATVLIKAPLTTIWHLHTDIDAWDTWIPEITPARKKTPGPLRQGSVFEWSPQNMHVTSTVKSVAPRRCTAWAAPVNGIDGIHLFTFEQVKGGVLATTEESWAGAPVEADIPGNQTALDTGLADWMKRLKNTAESTSCGKPPAADPAASFAQRPARQPITQG
ncbi:SRPBCC family protein [Streptomyces sp. NPDC057621]|uniref:SRPBCC family protein n=1 Tax=Streptomyces sp. NPDC057621 TaxID=3346186 RepID=UPI0036782D6B